MQTEEQKPASSTNDNWANRKKGMLCKTCMYFVEKVDYTGPERGCLIVGRCRRHAPVVQVGWPVILPTDWCGDHRLDETKI